MNITISSQIIPFHLCIVVSLTAVTAVICIHGYQLNLNLHFLACSCFSSALNSFFLLYFLPNTPCTFNTKS